MKMVISNKVQEFRARQKITQEELGQAVGVTRQTIIAIEKGHYTPSVLLALKLSRQFRTSVDKIFTIEEEV